jgi:hypothetical protein
MSPVTRQVQNTAERITNSLARASNTHTSYQKPSIRSKWKSNPDVPNRSGRTWNALGDYVPKGPT